MKTQSTYHNNKIWFLGTFLLLYTHSLYAYLDPGTGSMLLATIIGIVSTLLFTLRSVWYKILVQIHPSALRTKKENLLSLQKYKNIVFYSEGAQYWHTFSPIVQELHEQKIHCTYLSSDTNDPGLQYKSEYIHTKHIGTGNKAYAYLNMLEATVCVLTTPNLDTLQIKRSKGVSHYTHLIHAPTDIHLYKLFAFDFYDSIMVSGPHQEKSLRHLEQLRNTSQKQIFQVGCPYMDVLKNKVAQATTQTTHTNTNTNTKDSTILIAPTWGKSSLLNTYNTKLFDMLADNYSRIIVRPHPQSLQVESDFIEYLQDYCSNKKNIEWDTNPDNFTSLQEADILLSDRSGIIFDFAFIFKKPVITHNTAPVLQGMEGNDIPWNAWELDIVSQLGASITKDDIENLPNIIKETLDNTLENTEHIDTLQKKYLYHLGNTGKVATEILVELSKERLLKEAS